MLPDEFVGVAVGRIWRQEKQLQPAAERFDKGFGLFRAMRGAAINDQEDRACLTDQQPFEKFDKDIRVHPTFFLNHETHAAFRGDRRYQTHGMAGTSCRDNRGLSLLAPGAPRVMIGTDMSGVTKIYVSSLCPGLFLDLRVFRLYPLLYQRLIALHRLIQR